MASVLDSRAVVLDVTGLSKLKPRRQDWLRLDLRFPASVSATAVLTGTHGFPEPIPAVIARPGPPGDLIGTTWANVYAISERLKTVLEDAHLTGWVPYLLEVSSGELASRKVWLLTVRGRSGPVYGVDGAHRDGLETLGQYLDPKEWDGSDLFVPSNRNVILIARQAAETLEAAHLSNLELDPAGLEATP
jgi:hypothetical protein